jgi:hypothetical protein
MLQIPRCFQSSVFSFQFSDKTAVSGEHGTANSLHRGESSIGILRFAQGDNRPDREIRLGQQGGEKRKTLRAKVLGGSQKIFWETRKAL